SASATALGNGAATILTTINLADNTTFNVGIAQQIAALGDVGTPVLKNASVTLAGNTLTVGESTNNLSSTFSGVISGTGGLTKSSTTGTLTLTGASTFTGIVTISGG